MRLILAILAGIAGVLNAGSGLAQPMYSSPSYFAVDGVSADDVLNIRAAPNGSSDIVGSLAFDASPVEVLREQDGWGLVSTGEGMGWTSLSFLRPLTLSTLGTSYVPDGLACGGTEPFWGLTIGAAGVSFSAMDMSEAEFEMSVAKGFAGVGPTKNFIIGEGAGQSLTAVISDEICSDGMSDRDYARSVDMVMLSGQGPIGYSGCCSMPLN